jgi:hypothetical protein
MIQFENQFLHSSNDKAFEALYGVNTGNKGLLIRIYISSSGSLQVFQPFSEFTSNDNRTVVGIE